MRTEAMSGRLPPLNSLRAFEVAARRMSFRDAASELNVTPSALSYQIRQLEDHLGVPLFVRMNRAVALTAAGERLRPGLRDAFERMREAVKRAVPAGNDDVLVVSTGPAFAAKWLAPRVWRFMEAHPDIELRISASLRLVDFADGAVDCAIRFGPGRYPGLAVDALFDEAVLPLASPALGVATSADLAKTRLLHDDSTSFLPNAPGWPDWLRLMGFDEVDGLRGPRFSHADHPLDAALDGAGVALGRLSLAMRDIRAGRLVAPFDGYIPAAANFHFVAPEANLPLPKVQRFREWLAEETGAEAEAVSELLAERRSLAKV